MDAGTQTVPTGSRARAQEHVPPLSAIGVSLMKEVRLAVQSLEALYAHRETLGEPVIGSVVTVVDDVKRRLNRDNLFVCVVGEKKAGKSTFLNALLGERVLGTAVRECTGTVTLIRHAEQPDYQADLTGNRKEDFGQLFRKRQEEITNTFNEAKQQYQECVKLAGDLPQLEETAKHDAVAKQTGFVKLQGELKARQGEEEEAQNRLGEAQTALTSFEAVVLERGHGIPYFYRCLAYWWAVWVWLPRLVCLPWCKPEWKSHLEQVRALHAERARVQGIGKDAEDAKQRTGEADQRVNEGKAAYLAAVARIEELRRVRAELPGKTNNLRSTLERIKAEYATHKTERHQKFLADVRQLTDMAGRGGEVAQLALQYPGRLLLPGLTVIDTPGVNTDTVTNRERAWDVIRREADGCILISDMQQAVSASTKEFVRQVREVVPHLVLILTKVDRALSNAEAGDGLPWQQVEEARRRAERRFAQEVGRDPSEIFSFAVAAERALAGDNPEHARRFEADVKRLFDVLNREKTVMLAARSARAVRNCVANINEAHQRAETSYRERIAALEEQRIPDPKQFCREQLNRVERAVQSGAGAAVRVALGEFDREIAEIKEMCVGEVLGCGSADELKTYVNGLQSRLNRIFEALTNLVREHIKHEAGSALREIESPLLEALRERYQIAQQLVGGAGNRVGGARIDAQARVVTGVGVDLQGSVSQFQMERGGLFAGGAAAGAVVGSFVPVIGTIFGALIGGTLGWLFGPSLDDLKRDCAAKLAAALDQAEMQVRPQVVNSDDNLAESMRHALAAVLKKATQRYSGWIAGLIQDEERRIAEERRMLENLLQIRGALQAHDKRLADLGGAAADESRGLCR